MPFTFQVVLTDDSTATLDIFIPAAGTFFLHLATRRPMVPCTVRSQHPALRKQWSPVNIGIATQKRALHSSSHFNDQRLHRDRSRTLDPNSPRCVDDPERYGCGRCVLQ